jgi:hypothetical protein
LSRWDKKTGRDSFDGWRIYHPGANVTEKTGYRITDLIKRFIDDQDHGEFLFVSGELADVFHMSGNPALTWLRTGRDLLIMDSRCARDSDD